MRITEDKNDVTICLHLNSKIQMEIRCFMLCFVVDVVTSEQGDGIVICRKGYGISQGQSP